MPPKRKGKSLQSSQAPARKRTRLTTASAPIFASAKPEVAAPALPAAKTTVKRGPTTKSTPVVQIPPLTKDTRAGASNSPPRPDIYDVPSESSEDELQKPAAAPKAPTNGRSNKATINGKVPSRRLRAKVVTAGGEMDELASGDSPAVSKKTPTTRRTIQEKDEPASGVSPAVGKKTLATRRVKETEQGATPKTAVQDAKPPRTRNKGTSMRPRTKMQGKMG